jgi:glycosyltransferase involved in cell wall biosynthesis
MPAVRLRWGLFARRALLTEDGMRIGIDARLTHYTTAGIGQYTINLLNALAQADSADDFVVFQSRKARAALLEGRNSRCLGLWTPSHHRFEPYLLGLELLQYGLDVLHSPDFIPPFGGHFKSVITIHDLAFLLYPRFLTRDSARYYGRIDQAVRRTDHIIAVSESTRRDIVNLLGVSEDKITVIHEAADPLYRPLGREEAMDFVRNRFAVPDRFILFVSTIEPRKNVEGLLRAYRQFLDDYKLDLGLVLAGASGWLFEEVFRLVDELDLHKACRFLGRVNQEELLHLYNAARCLAHPAFYEGFGLTPLEAMACGTPVVVSNVSSLPEVVGDAAILVDPEDEEQLTVALWRLATDDDLWRELRERGLQRARAFSWDKTASRTVEVYHRVAGWAQ